MSTTRVILLVSDGASHPALTTAARAELVAKASAFKSAGNIIMCVGVRAVGGGFNLLNTISSGGFFINVFGDAVAVQEAITRLTCSLGYFCAGTRPAVGYGCEGFNCCDRPIGPQMPDPSNPWDLEDGDPPGPPPLLPSVVFSPVSGTMRSDSGLAVVLSVPGHPQATIRYTMDLTATPPEPSFADNGGTDYEGPNAPVRLPSAGPHNICIKAIAREAGFANSAVSQACYPPTTTIPGQLSGLRWDMPVITHIAALLASCENPPDQTVVLQGDLGRLYNLTLRFRGIVEAFPDYSGGTPDMTAMGKRYLRKPGDSLPQWYSGGGALLVGGTRPGTTIGNTYALIISDPPQTYWLNRKTGLIDCEEACMLIDYTKVIQVRTGATLTLKADAGDRFEVANWGFDSGDIRGFPLFVDNVPPSPSLSVGQFIQMDVVSVT